MKDFDRNIRFFGAVGQEIIRKTTVAIVGCGGLGQHVIQQLACLGVGKFILIDDEDLSATNLNRYVLAHGNDPIPGTAKVDIAKRAISLIDQEIQIVTIRAELRSKEAFDALLLADTIFGCLDNDGTRIVLNEFALAYGKALFDLASDTENDGQLRFGGRVSFVGSNPGCLVCMDVLDLKTANDDLANKHTREDRAKIYGVEATDLAEAGPSVVSLNGIIASLAVTEFMVHITGIRPAKPKLEYRGISGIVTVQHSLFMDDCYVCNQVRNAGLAANLNRYILKA